MMDANQQDLFDIWWAWAEGLDAGDRLRVLLYVVPGGDPFALSIVNLLETSNQHYRTRAADLAATAAHVDHREEVASAIRSEAKTRLHALMLQFAIRKDILISVANVNQSGTDLEKRRRELEQVERRVSIERPTPKLGLALSGGGFRASFFHLGVLKRLAELDLLRKVCVLSTVSGGSIVAAHYYLRLKLAMETTPSLDRAAYEKIVAAVEQEFRVGVACNLRMRLFANPIESLWLFVSGGSLGQRMARLYTKHLYRNALREAPNITADGLRKGPPLHNLKFDFKNHSSLAHELQADLDTFNRRQPNCVPKFVLNATCLNTACPFRFSIVEIGDPELGSIRFDEIDIVLTCKKALVALKPEGQVSLDVLTRAALASGRPTWGPGVGGGKRLPEAVPIEIALWYKAVSVEIERGKLGIGLEAEYRPLAEITAQTREGGTAAADVAKLSLWGLSRRLVTARFEHLRRAKIAVWWLHDFAVNLDPLGLKNDELDLRGGRSRDAWLLEFWDAMDDIDSELRDELLERFALDAPKLLELVWALYLCRSATAFGPGIKNLKSRITLSDAVASSANFPPVFAPFFLDGIFDPKKSVDRLGLTDGGVYDNQGIEALRAEGCTHIIASDAGGLLPMQSRPSMWRAIMMGRVIGTLMSNLRGYQLSSLREERRVSQGILDLPPTKDPENLRERYQLQSVVFFHMTSRPEDADVPGALPPHPLAKEIARIRTDLDSFCDMEVDALIYQGYQLADRFVQKYGSLDKSSIPPARNPIEINGAYVQKLTPASPRTRAVIEAAQQRVGRVLLICRTRSIVAGIVIFLAGISALLFTHLSMARVAEVILGAIGKFFCFPFQLELVRALVEAPFTAAILVVVLVVLFLIAQIPRRSTGKAIPARNCLWLVYAFPLLLVVVGCAVAVFTLGVITPLTQWLGKRRK
jgi:predicted acylesterase/phospholipase RssA